MVRIYADSTNDLCPDTSGIMPVPSISRLISEDDILW